MYYRLASTPWGSGLMSGLLFGVFMGVLVAVGGASLPATMLATGLAAATFGILMGLLSLSQLSVFDGLPPADRATVMRTVRKGEDTSDRRLAPAVIHYADSLRHRYRPSDTVWKWLVPVAVGVQVFVGLADLQDGDWFTAALRIPVVVVILLLPRTVRRAEERRERAERSARAVVDRPS